jgi:uncharacterized protein
MIEAGKYCTLRVVKILDFGAFLDGEDLGEILLPIRYVPKETKVNDELEVFLYFDSEDRLIATTEKPYATVGDFAYLRCVASNAVGSFMDWGLPKDLLVPFREQKSQMVAGHDYVVYVYLDEESNRLVGSTKLHRFYADSPESFEYNQEVDLLISHKTDFGYAAIINNCYPGILYHNEVFQKIERGDVCTGYIKNVRDDGKVDLSLQPLGYKKAIDPHCEEIIKYLKQNKGLMKLTDKSSPEMIYDALGISKKQFKKALGLLYKREIVELLPNQVKLLKTP